MLIIINGSTKFPLCCGVRHAVVGNIVLQNQHKKVIVVTKTLLLNVTQKIVHYMILHSL